ncbi:MAG: hypothetical protein ACREBB_02775 [Nitrosotalea sp.]
MQLQSYSRGLFAVNLSIPTIFDINEKSSVTITQKKMMVKERLDSINS